MVWIPQTAQTTSGISQVSIDTYVEFFGRNDLIPATG